MNDKLRTLSKLLDIIQEMLKDDTIPIEIKNRYAVKIKELVKKSKGAE